MSKDIVLDNLYIKDGKENVCSIPIILPILAMEAKNHIINYKGYIPDPQAEMIEDFFDILDKEIHEAKDMLIERFKYICSQSPESEKGTIIIGQLGLVECLQILIGIDHTIEEAMELIKRIEQLFKDRCAEFKQQYKLNFDFDIYFTPAENLCYTAMKKV